MAMNQELTRPTFFNRISSFFRKTAEEQSRLPVLIENISEGSDNISIGGPEPEEPRTTFLRPWSKRENAIDQLQNGVAALSDLMGTIRETLEKNGSRQDELLAYLSHIPAAMEAIPESHRVQGEALQAIQSGIEQQNSQQNKLAQVLEKMNRDDIANSRILATVREKVETIAVHEEAISRSLTSVGSVLQSVNTTSQAGTKVLESLRENLSVRDSDLEKVIRRQNTRFTTMLTVAIVMSMAALTSVVVFGYLGYETLNHMVK
jgi:chromosome segregation ATPase